MKRRTVMLLLLLLVAVAVYAGDWIRVNGRTYWDSRPHPMSHWRSRVDGTLIPCDRPLVFHDTRNWMSNGTQVVDEGFWLEDSSGNKYPNPSLTASHCTTGSQQTSGMWLDNFWHVDGDGNLFPKP